MLHNLHDGSICQSHFFVWSNFEGINAGCLRGNVSNLSIWLLLESILLLKIWNQVLLCDIEFFNRQVSRHVNDLYSVKKRSEHICNRITGANENTLTKVKLEVKITVTELIGLLWIQKFKQCRWNITLHWIHTNLINFINHDDGILWFQSLQFLHEDAWLTVNISSLATFDVNRIVLASHWDNGGWSFKTFTNRFCYGSFANSRRSSQQENHALLRVDSLILSNEL